MTDVKIGILAEADSAKTAVNVMTNAVNSLARSVAQANNTPFKAPGFEQAFKDLTKLQKQFQQAIAMSAALRNALATSGQNPAAGILNVDWSKLSVDPKAAQRLRDRAFTYAARGTAWDRTNVPNSPTPAGPRGGRGGGGSGADDDDDEERRPAWRRAFSGFGRRAASVASGGIGGPVGQIADEGFKGAAAGAAEGGMGLAGGLLAGLGAGAVLVGLAKVGQFAAHGYDLAKQNDLGLDTLKRQMGDLGVSFDLLKATADRASDGLGLNAVEFAQLEQLEVQASRGAERTPVGIADATQTSVGFARAYGMDPSQAVSFFGGMRQIDPRQSQRELALFIADAIQRTGGHAMPADVMQAVQSLTAAAQRMSLASPHAAPVAGSYASLVNENGMTADGAASLLGAANTAVSNMGAAGEAGQNFIWAALNHEGGAILNPIAARALSAEGLFGTRASAFSHSGELGKFMRGDASFAALSGGPGAGVTNLDAIRRQLRESYGDNRWLQLDAAQHLFGVSSLQQAAALMNMDSRGLTGLSSALAQSGVKLDDVNESGLRTLAAVGGATSMDQLRGIYGDMASRTGPNALSDSERGNLDALSQSGDMQGFRSALIRAAAAHGQEDTEGSSLRQSTASLENIQKDIGDKLVPYTNEMRIALAKLAGKDGKAASLDDLRKLFEDANGKGSSDGPSPPILDAYTGDNPRGLIDNFRHLAYMAGGEGPKMKLIAADEKKYGLPEGLLKGVWGAESSFGVDIGRNSVGAEGNFQQTDANVKQWGVTRGDFASEADGASRYLSYLIKKDKGDVKAALFEWNGVQKNVAAGENFVERVSSFGNTPIDGSYVMGAKIVPYDLPSAADSKIPADQRTPGAGVSGAQQTVENNADGTSTVVLDIGVNLKGSDGAGKPVSSSVKTSVGVPRGAGTQRISMQAQ
ncbi:MAG: hypothetical protein PW999_16670 [Paraburkholderia tropica]|nr:hypothetical protein [Paraburkholderia tropica]